MLIMFVLLSYELFFFCSGYMSPEYAMEGIVSVKSDVYSFGVLVLEIISGRRNTSFNDDRPMNLIGHVCEISLLDFFLFLNVIFFI